VRPGEVAVQADVVAEVPGDVGKGREAVGRVAQVAALVVAAGGGVDARVVPVQDDRDDQVQLARVVQQALEFLPVGDVEAAVVEAGVGRVGGAGVR